MLLGEFILFKIKKTNLFLNKLKLGARKNNEHDRRKGCFQGKFKKP